LFGDARPPMESVQRAEVIESKYTHADIVYKPFSEITYKIIKGKSVQMARDGVASFIPRDIDEELNQIASEYNLGQQEKSQKAEQYEQEQRRKMYESFQNSLKGGVSIGNINEFRRTPTEIKRENNVNISNRKFVAPKIQERQEDFVIKSVVGGKSENKNKQSPNKVIDEEVKDEYSPTEFDMPEEFDVNIN